MKARKRAREGSSWSKERSGCHWTATTKVIGRDAFQGFDDAVVGAVSDRAKALAEGRGGLVVGGVDGDGEAADPLG